MKRRFQLPGLMLLLLFSPANGQGLKGAPEPVRLGQSPPLIKGKSDEERWQKFLAIQKELIGMSYEDVVRRLGPCYSDKKKMCIQYELTETKTPSAPGKLASLNILIKLNNNRVDSFTVQAVHWSN